jgi:futalosine hydrolase
MIERSRILVIAATDREADCFRGAGLSVMVSGVGRTNAAVATTLAVVGRKNPPLVISAGIAGSLTGGENTPAIGSLVIGSAACYAEEGLLTSEGFTSIAEMGFPVATFADGNSIPADPGLFEALRRLFPGAATGPIATVATCSGTDELAAGIALRTGAIAEAMEGAAVLHAARLLGARSVELRSISNRTGNRDRQDWRLPEAFAALETAAAVLSSI